MTECVNVRIFYSQIYATYGNKEKGRKTKKLCHTNKMKINLKWPATLLLTVTDRRTENAYKI